MKAFTVIGLCGAAGSGKDTAADILSTHAGFIKLGFADALREEVSDAFAIEHVYLTHRATKELPIMALALKRCQSAAFVACMQVEHQAAGRVLDLTAARSPRWVMQQWGTQYRRAGDGAYWTRQVQRRMDRLMVSGAQTRFCITDCRFANEVAMLRAGPVGALLWRVVRPGCQAPAGAHASETALEGCEVDAVVHNDGDIDQLAERVLGLYAAHEWSRPGLQVLLPRPVAGVTGRLRPADGAAQEGVAA